jgi:hypothetical protein
MTAWVGGPNNPAGANWQGGIDDPSGSGWKSWFYEDTLGPPVMGNKEIALYTATTDSVSPLFKKVVVDLGIVRFEKQGDYPFRPNDIQYYGVQYPKVTVTVGSPGAIGGVYGKFVVYLSESPLMNGVVRKDVPGTYYAGEFFDRGNMVQELTVNCPNINDVNSRIAITDSDQTFGSGNMKYYRCSPTAAKKKWYVAVTYYHPNYTAAQLISGIMSRYQQAWRATDIARCKVNYYNDEIMVNSSKLSDVLNYVSFVPKPHKGYSNTPGPQHADIGELRGYYRLPIGTGGVNLESKLYMDGEDLRTQGAAWVSPTQVTFITWGYEVDASLQIDPFTKSWIYLRDICKYQTYPDGFYFSTYCSMRYAEYGYDDYIEHGLTDFRVGWPQGDPINNPNNYWSWNQWSSHYMGDSSIWWVYAGHWYRQQHHMAMFAMYASVWSNWFGACSLTTSPRDRAIG